MRLKHIIIIVGYILLLLCIQRDNIMLHSIFYDFKIVTICSMPVYHSTNHMTFFLAKNILKHYTLYDTQTHHTHSWGYTTVYIVCNIMLHSIIFVENAHNMQRFSVPQYKSHDFFQQKSYQTLYNAQTHHTHSWVYNTVYVAVFIMMHSIFFVENGHNMQRFSVAQYKPHDFFSSNTYQNDISVKSAFLR